MDDVLTVGLKLSWATMPGIEGASPLSSASPMTVPRSDVPQRVKARANVFRGGEGRRCARIRGMTSSRVGKADRLRRAAGSQALVRIKRSPRNADRVDGIVVAVGSKWALIAPTGDGGFLEGLVAIRVKDVVKVGKDSSFAERFARTQPEWPPTAPAGLDLDTTAGLLRGMSAISPLLAIEQERRFHSQMAWIGIVDDVTERWLWLYEVRPNATWCKRPLGYKLRRITKVFISSRYLTALEAIAGTGPTH
jgi:hypothetical protein